MTFISEALYQSLKKEQASLLANIADLEQTVDTLKDRIKREEAFLASFDAEQSKLQATKDNAELSIENLERRSEDALQNQEDLESRLEQKEEQIADAEKDLKKAIR